MYYLYIVHVIFHAFSEFGVLGDYVFSPNMIIVQDQSSSSVNVTLYTDGIALEEPETFQLTLTPVFTCETSHVVIRDVINVTIIDKDGKLPAFSGYLYNHPQPIRSTCMSPAHNILLFSYSGICFICWRCKF